MKAIKNYEGIITAVVMLFLFAAPLGLKAQCAVCSGYTINNYLGCSVKVDWYVLDPTSCLPVSTCVGTSVPISSGGSISIPGTCCVAGADIWVQLVEVNGTPVSSIIMDGCGPCGSGHNFDSGTVSGSCPSWSITWGITSTDIN